MSPGRAGWLAIVAAFSCSTAALAQAPHFTNTAKEPAATTRPKGANAGSPVKAPEPAPDRATPAPTQPVVRVKATAEARTCFQRAQTAYVAGDLAKALEGFLCAYRAAPSPELHFNLGRVYERMGEAEEGIRHYQAYLDNSNASQISPREKKQIEARLQGLRELRERQRAPLQEAKPTAEALSAEARVFYDRGVKLYRARDYSGALAAFSAALQMSSAPELHFNLAVVSERLNRTREAVDHYRAYLAARPRAADRELVVERIELLQTRTQ